MIQNLKIINPEDIKRKNGPFPKIISLLLLRKATYKIIFWIYFENIKSSSFSLFIEKNFVKRNTKNGKWTLRHWKYSRHRKCRNKRHVSIILKFWRAKLQKQWFLRNEINLNFDWGTIGLVLGGILLLILIIFVIVFFCSRGACKGIFTSKK